MAPKVPQKITLRCVFLGRLRATRPMIRALSPASTRSIRTMANRADTKAAENSSGCTRISNEKGRKKSVFSSELDGHLFDGAAPGRPQDLHDDGSADAQHADAERQHGAGQQELQQMPVAHRQHGELAAEVEDGELQARLAEQRRI